MTPAKFRPGDLVCLRGKHTVWQVVAEDTNQTPVRDPEPAYRLRALVGRRRDDGHLQRYAFESDLEPA